MKRLFSIIAFLSIGLSASGASFGRMYTAWQIGSNQNANEAKMTNADVVDLVGLGLSDDVVIDKIHAAKGTSFDTSVAGLKSLKAAKVSDAVIRTMINPSNSNNSSSGSEPSTSATANSSQPGSDTPLPNKPRVFLEAASHGSNQNANRDQSMEMGKDFERDCADVTITINQQMADYTVSLNHIEAGLYRDNQIQVANKAGDLISKTKEGGSIRSGMKKACGVILDDWNKRPK